MPEKIEIKASKNGPYLIAGNAAFTDSEGNLKQTEGKMFALCRCGQSANKPFCDGSHKRVNFEAPEVTLTLSIISTPTVISFRLYGPTPFCQNSFISPVFCGFSYVLNPNGL